LLTLLPATGALLDDSRLLIASTPRCRRTASGSVTWVSPGVWLSRRLVPGSPGRGRPDRSARRTLCAGGGRRAGRYRSTSSRSAVWSSSG